MDHFLQCCLLQKYPDPWGGGGGGGGGSWPLVTWYLYVRFVGALYSLMASECDIGHQRVGGAWKSAPPTLVSFYGCSPFFDGILRVFGTVTAWSTTECTTINEQEWISGNERQYYNLWAWMSMRWRQCNQWAWISAGTDVTKAVLQRRRVCTITDEMNGVTEQYCNQWARINLTQIAKASFVYLVLIIGPYIWRGHWICVFHFCSDWMWREFEAKLCWNVLGLDSSHTANWDLVWTWGAQGQSLILVVRRLFYLSISFGVNSRRIRILNGLQAAFINSHSFSMCGYARSLALFHEV
jgi:hypothetical protein